ncbi:uncharacterized protein LOC123871658 [Maniola jurtina]|uniref:uncharacterized protein LOC123871658 n=1 Tax=Maniola jurtina TaxID=191418 RepID=UPI001E68B47D|nr:uncharacterized protein LOC123871658 [Maniola jurtina]
MSERHESYRTWVRFELKRKDDSVVKLRIQDLPLDRIDDATEFLLNNYMKEESFQVAAGIPKNEEAILENLKIKRSMLERPNISSVMCCLDDQDTVGEIIGLSIMGLDKNSEKLKNIVRGMEFKTKEIKNLFHILLVLEEYVGDKSFETYYGDRGLSVHPDYRGLGLANEFVRVRKLICIEHKVPMACAWMTAIESQKAAAKNNWKTLTEISPEELEKLTGLKFEKKVPSFKLMYTTTD